MAACLAVATTSRSWTRIRCNRESTLTPNRDTINRNSDACMLANRSIFTKPLRPQRKEIPPLEDSVYYKWRFYYEPLDTSAPAKRTFHVEWQFGMCVPACSCVF